MNNRKENLTASFFSVPKNKAVAIVEPDLEIPGVIARPCITPIANAETELIFLFFSNLSQENNNNPVIIKAIPAGNREEKALSNKPWKNIKRNDGDLCCQS